MAAIELLDEVNVRFRGVDSETLKEAQSFLTFGVPNARFMPAYKLGRWDGKVRLMSKTGRTMFNLLEDVVPFIEEQGYDLDIIDNRIDYSKIIDEVNNTPLPDENYFSDYELNGEKVVLRDYQVGAVHAAINESSGILEMATNSGKTLVCAVLADFYSKFGKSIVIVPSIDLVIQTQDKFEKLGIDCGIWYGEVKKARQVTVTTWQSLENSPELFHEAVFLIVDEAHEAKAKTLTEILTGPGANTPFRFGCTGTLPKEVLFRKQLYGSIGPVIFEIKSWELQQKGVSAKSKIHMMKFNDKANPRFTYRDSDNQPVEKTFDEWKEQVDLFFKDEKRLGKMTEIIKDVTDNLGNTLILVNYRDHSKALTEALEKIGTKVIAIDGRDTSDKRKQQYDRFESEDDVVLIASYGIARRGIDIARIFNMFIIEPGKRYETALQVLGRGLRKGRGKDHINFFDMHGNTAMSKKHAAQRKKFYKEAKHDIEEIDVEYM